MELEELRTSWEVHSRNRGINLEVSEAGLEKILEEKLLESKSLISRKLKWDAILMLLVTGLSVGLLYILQLEYRTGGALVLTLAALLLFVHYHFTSSRVNQKLKDVPVCRQAQLTLSAIQRYTRIYQWIAPLILSSVFYLGWYFGFYNVMGLVDGEMSPAFQLLSTLIFGIICWGVLWVIIRSSFHSEIRRLRELIKQLEG